MLIGIALTEIQPFKNAKITQKYLGILTQSPDGHTFFVNFDFFKWLYLAYDWVYLYQTWGFCKAWCALYDYVDQ